MKEIDYATAVARIRVNETALLDESDVSRLVTSKSVDEAVSLLVEKGFGKQGDDYSKILDGQMEKAWELIREIAPNKNEFDFLLVKNDFHNLKAILKGIVTDTDYKKLLLFPSVVDVDLIALSIKEQKFDILPKYMSDVAKKAYDYFVSTSDGQLSDLCIDSGSLKAIFDLSKENKNDFIKQLCEIIVATYNLRIAVRCAKTNQKLDVIKLALCDTASLPSDSLSRAAAAGMDELKSYIDNSSYSAAAKCLDDSIAEFEKWCDNALVDYVEKCKYSCFGPAPLAAYIIRKEAQLKTIRIILSGLKAGLSSESITKRIRKVY